MITLLSYCLLVGVVGTQVVPSSNTDLCQDGHYYNLIDKKCNKCSNCPTNQIIKFPCTKYSDLKCSPFNFKDFPESNSLVDDIFEDSDYFPFNANKKKSYRVSSRGKAHDDDDGESPTTMEKEDREYWKTLAFALIGLLSVLIVVATVVVLLACRRLQRAVVIKQPDEGDMDDADSGYVVIRAIRIGAETRNTAHSCCTKDECDAHPALLGVTSSDTDLRSDCTTSNPHPRHLCFLPKVYKPQRRLLNYDADDVFESDDSGSLFMPGKTKLQTIAEKSLD